MDNIEAMVMELIEVTGADPMDCMNALQSAGGNLDAAVKYLRKQGEDKKMSKINEMRVMKFETMVKEIMDIFAKAEIRVSPLEFDLAMIYDYDDLNDYGKAIMEQTYRDIRHMRLLSNDQEERKSTIRGHVGSYNNSRSYDKSKFIFWALMVLTVDDTRKEEYLTLVCDFARMLKISDEEMLDILKVVQVIYNKADDIIEFNSKLEIGHKYGEILNKYDYHWKSGPLPDLFGLRKVDKEDGEKQEVEVWEKAH